MYFEVYNNIQITYIRERMNRNTDIIVAKIIKLIFIVDSIQIIEKNTGDSRLYNLKSNLRTHKLYRLEKVWGYKLARLSRCFFLRHKSQVNKCCNSDAHVCIIS